MNVLFINKNSFFFLIQDNTIFLEGTFFLLSLTTGSRIFFEAKIDSGQDLHFPLLIQITNCLENGTNEILLDNKTIEAARKSVIRMTDIGR